MAESSEHPRAPGSNDEQRILWDIKDAVQGFEARANYACGGTIPINPGERNIGEFGATKGPITCPPVTLRWDSLEGRTKKIQFPPTEDAQYASMLQELIDDCSPASFGRHGKDVFDDEYRKATKLDNTQFAVDFTPYDYGIISAIAQTILPGFAIPKLPGKNTALEHIGVVAELYKLNVYSAPSGFFKAHVDTPRGATQFGSLVVSLPCQHQGGGLRVSHKGHQIVYDWSNGDASALSWAAFYSDVEHEVNPVTSGHRITLTYNLYISEHVGGVVNPVFPSIYPDSYPLFECVKKALERPDFLPEGGILGFHCCHKYAHTDGAVGHRMPFALKGLDVAIFSVFSDLGLKVCIKPCVQLECDSDCDTPYERGYSPPSDMDQEEADEKWREQYEIPRFGEFMGITGGNYKVGYDKAEILEEVWPHSQHEVTWLNEDQLPSEENMAYIAHGNQASLGWVYTTVAILIHVPDAITRKLDGRVNRNMTLMNVDRNNERPKPTKRNKKIDPHQDVNWPPSLHQSLPFPAEDLDEARVADYGAARMSWTK